MKPLTFITDETHNRRYIQDLAEVADINDEQLEDIMDIIIAKPEKMTKRFLWKNWETS